MLQVEIGAHTRSLQEAVFTGQAVNGIETIERPGLAASPGGVASPALVGRLAQELTAFQVEETLMGGTSIPAHDCPPGGQAVVHGFLVKFVVVRLDGWAYANDDEQPGMLTSSVLIHAPADRDAEALLEISNRGVYGPAQTYTVNVEEVLTTPTPSPAPTLSPTPQPTPTFDLRDGHEPDDQSPTIIEPGESQTHSFYPDGDVDRLSFLAQGHKAYRVYTEGLAPDVDTFLYVRVGADSYVHDNVGENDPRSEVCIEIGDTENVTVIIEVSNRGRYGPAQWYRIAVEEIDPVPTCTPTPTMTPVPGDAVASSPTLTMPTGTPVAILQQEPTRLMVAAKDSVYTAHRRGLCAPFDTQQNSVNGRAALLQGESGITLQYAAFDDANESAEGTSVVEFAILLEMEIAP